MTGTAKTLATTARIKPARKSLLRRLIAWNEAWREVQHIRGLDVHALRDIGLTEEQRDSVTWRQIVNRTGY